MIAGLKNRVATLRGGQGLQADLKRVTDSGVTDIPKELLTTIVEASSDADSRREIMKHLQACLAEPAGAKKWRRIYAGLLLTESLMLNGSNVILAETAEGHHFDVVQRLAFLEHFELTSDRRAQHMMRTKAKELRVALIPQLQSASDEGLLKQMVDAATVAENASTCSPGSNATIQTGSSLKTETETNEWHGVELPKAGDACSTIPKVINGIVAVGHNDDTTDEESSGNENKSGGAPREQHRSSKKERDQRSSLAQGSPSPVAAASPAQTVNLLDF